MLFRSFSPINDIIAGEKKISGNAQTRRGGVLLQHGTLLYKVDVDKMFSLLNVGKEKIADKLINNSDLNEAISNQNATQSFDIIQKYLFK